MNNQTRADQPGAATWMGGLAMRPLFVGAALVVALVGALVYAAVVMGAPVPVVGQIALILLATGSGSLLLSAAVVQWGGARLGSLRLRFTLVYGLGLLVALV